MKLTTTGIPRAKKAGAPGAVRWKGRPEGISYARDPLNYLIESSIFSFSMISLMNSLVTYSKLFSEFMLNSLVNSLVTPLVNSLVNAVFYFKLVNEFMFP